MSESGKENELGGVGDGRTKMYRIVLRWVIHKVVSEEGKKGVFAYLGFSRP